MASLQIVTCTTVICGPCMELAPAFPPVHMQALVGCSHMPADCSRHISPKLVSQFHAKCSTILDYGRSLNLLSHRVGVMLVEQVIEAGRNSQFS